MVYFAPRTLDEALGLLASARPRVVAGGTDHFPSRPAGPERQDLLDLTRIGALRGISQTDEGWRIGATTTWTDMADAGLPPAFCGLQAAAREVGSVQIQNAGTIAGNLCNASPAADGVPPLLTLDAEVELMSTRGRRRLALDRFLLGPRRTALAADELMTAILIPPQPDHVAGAFHKLGARRYLVISITMAAAVIGVGPDGRIDHARVAVGACSPVALRLAALETELTGQAIADLEILPHHLAPLAPIDDVRGSAGFRLEVVAEQITRLIRRAGGSDG